MLSEPLGQQMKEAALMSAILLMSHYTSCYSTNVTDQLQVTIELSP